MKNKINWLTTGFRFYTHICDIYIYGIYKYDCKYMVYIYTHICDIYIYISILVCFSQTGASLGSDDGLVKLWNLAADEASDCDSRDSQNAWEPWRGRGFTGFTCSGSWLPSGKLT
jgi:hypothetical protein